MRFKGFVGPSYTLQSPNVDAQRCIGFYPEMDEMMTGNEGEVGSLVQVPGLRLLNTLPTGPVRGSFTDSQKQLWKVGGNVLYKLDSLFNYTAIGTLQTNSGPVSMADNGSELVLVDGPCGYSCTLNASINALPSQYTSTPTASGTTTLTEGSTFQQYFTGTLAQAVVLPVVSTLDDGPWFNIVNQSSGVITIQASTLNTLTTVNPGQQVTVTCTNSGGDSDIDCWSFSSSTISSNTFYQITDPNFLGSDQVSFIDDYFIFNKPGSRTVYNSPLEAVLPFDGTNVATTEANPGNLIGHAATQENLYLFCENTVEIYYNNAGSGFPFARIQGAVIEIGCAAAFSIAKIQNSVFWLGQDETGRGVVYTAQGLQPERISTFALETVIQKLGDLSSARAWAYSQSGHSFYCLNLPGADTTWCFDTMTNLWHERAYLSQGQYARHLADCHAFAYNINVVGDYSNGNIYALDPTFYSDDGNPMPRERAAPHVSKDMNWLFHSMFQLDVEMGLGLTGVGQGTNPQAMLQWSDDNGYTWSNEKWKSIGPIGKRHQRAIWRRLGKARDRIYRMKITDPVKVTILGAQIDFEEGAA